HYSINDTTAHYSINDTTAHYSINDTTAHYSINDTTAHYSLNDTAAHYSLNKGEAPTRRWTPRRDLDQSDQLLVSFSRSAASASSDASVPSPLSAGAEEV
ncbi:hypothetical protein, partial [Rarobacter incanus]